MTETKITGHVARVEHAGTSRYGNPTYRVHLTDGASYLTETDGGVGYAATNFRPNYRRPDQPLVTLTLRRNRIVSMREQ